MIKNLLQFLQHFKVDIICLGLLIVFGLIALRSLLSVPFYTSHDGFTHTARIAAYFDTLKDGQFPPRWAKNLNGQLGSPIFTYSYPLVYFLGAILHYSGMSYETAFRALMVFGFLLSGLGAYLWLARKFGKPAGFVGAMFYMWVPYHFLNVYVRAAIAENLAYGFLPFVFLAIEEVYRSTKTKFWSIILIFSVTAVLLSHNLVSAVFLPIFIIWTLLWGIRHNNWKKRFGNILGLTIPFFLTAFIYVPDFLERNFIRFDQGISYYTDHFVAWWQLIRSPWGYGFDLPGTANDAMSFQLGLAHLLVLASVFMIIIVKIFKDRKTFIKSENLETVFFLALFVILIFLTVEFPFSQTLWKSLPLVKTIIDFPWRLLGPMTFVLAYLAAFLITQFKNKIIPVFVLLIFVLIANRNFLRVNEAISYGDKAYDNYTGTSTAGSGEYTPAWHDNLQFPVKSQRIDWVNPKSVHLLTNKVDLIEFSLDPSAQPEARINRFYFPDTQVYHNGKLLQQGIDWTIIKNKTGSAQDFDDTGLIIIKLDRSGGKYRLVFQETPLRDFANKLSLVTLIVLLSYILVLRHDKK